ncbi:MAG: hypothetical protein Q9220_003255 [cf. Caloplaca sp. 1 TL-2023]
MTLLYIACLSLVLLHSFSYTHASVPSPKASTPLICHTNHASECYPRIFQPTEKFRVVHHDQDLPPGLHVRMNLATGVKEARLNVPEPNEGEYNEVPSALTIIDTLDDHPEYAPEKSQRLSNEEQDMVAKNKPLQSSEYSVADSTLYASSVHAIKISLPAPNDENLLTALSNLEDLAHSYHWGLTIAKDEVLIHDIYRLLLPSEDDVSIEIRSLATLVLGTAIHNNEAALKAVLAHFNNNSESPEKAPMEAVIFALSHGERDPRLLNRMLFLLSSLCRDGGQRDAFFDRDGIDMLLQIDESDFAPGGGERGRVRRKITNFVVDYLVPSEGDEMGEQLDLDYEWTVKHLRYALDERRRVVQQPG